MTIRTPPTRTSPAAPSRSAPEPLIVAPGTIAPGRARAAPLRREGPAKLTGEAKYADDLVFPGAWFGATIRSTDAHARFVALDLDPAFDWSKVVVVTAADIPGENIVSLISDDQPVLVPVGGEIQHHAEPLALLAAAGPRNAPGGTGRRHGKDGEAAGRSSTRACRITCSPTTTSPRAISRRVSRRPTTSSRERTASVTRSSSTSRTTR